jgi:hypothetical protein
MEHRPYCDGCDYHDAVRCHCPHAANSRHPDLNSAEGIGKPRSSGSPHNDEGVPM